MQTQQKAKLGAVHPTVAHLESVMADLSIVRAEYGSTVSRMHREAQEAMPTRWTERIEKAHDDSAELERLRIQYDEKALTFFNELIRANILRHRFYDLRMTISEAIREVIAVHDAIRPNTDQVWTKPILAGAIIAASDEHSAEPYPRSDEINLDALCNRAQKLMYAAYTTLAQWLSKPTCNPSYYPNDLVVDGKKATNGFFSRDVDLRRVYAVEFVDCVNSKHPANAELAQRLTEMAQALTAAREAMKSFKSDEKGNVNERQHAARLMDMLHGQSNCYGANNMTATLEAQNERRWRYEVARQAVVIANRILTNAREAVAAALRAASKEATPLIDATFAGNNRMTVDQYDTVRVMMNNCLAADAELRSVGREITVMEEEQREDVADKAGSRALQAKYEATAPSYRRFTEPADKGKGGETRDADHALAVFTRWDRQQAAKESS